MHTHAHTCTNPHGRNFCRRVSQEFLRAATTNNRVVRFSISKAIAFIVRSEGLRGLYRGVQLNFVKTAPAMAISFTCYDRLRTALGVPPGKFSATRG